MEQKTDKDKMPAWYWLVLPPLLLLLSSLYMGRGDATLPYSDFKRVLHARKLEEVRVAPALISGTLHDDGLEQLLPAVPTSRRQRRNDRPDRDIAV